VAIVQKGVVGLRFMYTFVVILTGRCSEVVVSTGLPEPLKMPSKVEVKRSFSNKNKSTNA
jgi:hypothetical protein